MNRHERYLKPTKRKTKVKGKEYIHYVVCTTVPEEWKDGVKITIQPLKDVTSEEYFDVANYRMEMRDLNEQGEDFNRMVEEHIKQEEARFRAQDPFNFFDSPEWKQMSKEEKGRWLKENEERLGRLLEKEAQEKKAEWEKFVKAVFEDEK